MLNVIDLSSNNGSFDPASSGADAVIVKMTQGLSYVNKKGAWQVARTRASSKLLGLYHFARLNNATSEFNYFWQTASKYWQPGDVIVLDYEPVNMPSNTPAWLNQWATACYAKTGVWPWIYSYGSMFTQFYGKFGTLPSQCAAWPAGGAYYNAQHTFSTGLTKLSSLGKGWTVAAWQYSQVGHPGGTSGNVDLSVFYGTRATWLAYGGKASAGIVAVTNTTKTSAKTGTLTIGGITVATNMTEQQFIDAVAKKVAQAVANQILGHNGPTIGLELQNIATGVTNAHADIVKLATKQGVKLS